ncbi:MAG: archaeosortase/exosortase family protein, partial [Lentisphaeria bacterium]
YSRLLTIIAALPVAVGVNVFRITITGVLYPFNPQFTRGDTHEMTGLLLLIPGMMLLLGLTKLLDHYFGFKGYQDIRLKKDPAEQ